MKKFISINLALMFLLLTAILSGSGVYASSQNTIRIGLESRYNNAQSVGIGNSSILVGYDTGGGFRSSAQITSSQGLSMVVNNSFYLDSNERFNNYQSAQARANALNASGNNAVVVLLNNNSFAIYFGGYASAAEAEAALRSNSAARSVVQSSNSRVTLRDGNSKVLVFDNPTHHPQIIDANGGFVSIGGREYRGVIELGRQTGQGITPVNILDVEEYLYSVVPSEMPGSWPMEALKAQAVAARSYTFARRGSHSHLGYELCDTVFSQAYSGVSREYPRTTEAVRQTSGLKAYHNGNVIMATYFSSSGGTTENSENVWINAVPYLRGIEDTFEEAGMVWERTFTMAEMTQITSANGVHIGNVVSVSIIETTPGGRVSNLLITGTEGTHNVTGEAIRTFFRHSNDGSLHSRNFQIVDGTTTNNSNNNDINIGDNFSIAYAYGTAQRPVTSSFVLDSNGNIVHINDANIILKGAENPNNNMPSGITVSSGDSVTFSGRGWGHGVGMSQFGAKGMAQAGFTYQEILKHYYTDIEIR